MREFRFNGVGTTGEAIRGSVFAANRRAAEKRVDVLSERHQFEPEQVEERFTFKYRVRHVNGNVVRGEQKAYSSEEVVDALERLGLEVLNVRKRLFGLRRKPPSTDSKRLKSRWRVSSGKKRLQIKRCDHINWKRKR